MSVYIKGMEMPKSCWECACHHRKMDNGYYDYEVCLASGTVFNDGYASVTGHKDKIDPFKSRLKNCPLVPVPPHGRLIDADAMEDELGQFCDDNWVYNTLHHAPTIIEAEEGE